MIEHSYLIMSPSGSPLMHRLAVFVKKLIFRVGPEFYIF
jgi:hypothetical protein